MQPMFETNIEDMTPEEKQGYIDFVKDKAGSEFKKVKSIIVSELNKEDGTVKVTWEISHPAKFERIRRITGYLVGTVDRWNDAKRAELHDRVTHI